MDIIKKDTFEGRPDDNDVQFLNQYGYMMYDAEQGAIKLTKEGILNLLSAFNAIKRRANQLDEKLKTCIPMETLAKDAIRAFKRDPQGQKAHFLHTEDVITTWSEANGGVGQDILKKMEEAYEEVMAKEEARQERRWLLEHQGKQVSVDGNYHDSSNTQEHHIHA